MRVLRESRGRRIGGILLSILFVSGTIAAVGCSLCLGSQEEGKVELVFSSIFGGGNDNDMVTGGVQGPNGEIYLIGHTNSDDFPVTADAYDTEFGGGGVEDLFIARFSSNMTEMLSCTYFGGSDREWYSDIAIDSDGKIIVAGVTMSNDFPTTAGAYNTTPTASGTGRFFVSRFSSDLTTLETSTLMDGTAHSYYISVAIGEDGSIFVAADTEDPSVTTSADAFQRTFGGKEDSILIKFSSDLADLLACTYLGGSKAEVSFAMTLTGEGDVCLTGITFSTDFPTTAGAYDTTINGDQTALFVEDAFVALLDSTLSTLKHSTYVGGYETESFYDIDLDSEGNIVLGGDTTSSDFPTSSDAYCSELLGLSDGVVVKFDPTLSTLIEGTYLRSNSLISSVSVLDDGRVITTGFCSALTVTDDAADPTFSGGTSDAFVAILSSDLHSLRYCTYFGGDDVDDVGRALVKLDQNRVLIAGITGSTNFPTTDGSTGMWDCFASVWRTK
jgi:hypothetical protein